MPTPALPDGIERRRPAGRLLVRRLPALRRDRPLRAGDGRRCGAFAAAGGPVLGICNGFQILCEAGLLPGVLRLNRQQQFLCADVTVTVESTSSAFAGGWRPGDELVIPIKHGEGNWYGDDDLLAVARGQRADRVPLHRGRQRRPRPDRRRHERGRQRPRPDAAPRARGRPAARPDRRVAVLEGPHRAAARSGWPLAARRLADGGLATARHSARPSSARRSSGARRSIAPSFARSRSRSVTGPRRAAPSVV